MEYAEIAVDKIYKSDSQPRQHFDEKQLEELADSIREVGQLQPVIVQKKGDQYLLIAGERRYRALAENNEEDKIAAVILEQDLNEFSLSQIRLIENLQREDLNPLERALSIQKFIEENNLTKKAASEKLGVPRTTLTEWLNILEVKSKYQRAVLDDDSSLTLSHITLAKSLASRTGDPSKLKKLLNAVMKYNFSRSETKEIVDLFHKYLHMSMEEACAAILLKREQQQSADKINTDSEGSTDPAKSLLNMFNRVSENVEKFMENVGELEQEQRKNLIDEFLYIYQLLEIMVPEFQKYSLEELIDIVRQDHVKK